MEAKHKTTCPICHGPRRAAWSDKAMPGFTSGKVVYDPHYRGPVGHTCPFQRGSQEIWLAGTEVCCDCWVEAWDEFARNLEGWKPRTKLAMAIGLVSEGYTQAQAAGLVGMGYSTLRLRLHELRKNEREIVNILSEFGGVVQHIYYRGGV